MIQGTPHELVEPLHPAPSELGGADGDRSSQLLKPYVPLLVIDWLRTNPGAPHRALEASMVFVDISGFTALTERLAKKGKIGAELMRDTLDGVFRALLDDAYDFGAGLLKWGGDALLLLFDGPEHERRACRAAWEMQRTIDRVGQLNVSGGKVTLRMSVGIGTGTFHFFMTGSAHRELVVAGPAMSETLQIEAIADAGEVGVSPALAAKLDPSCVGSRKGTAFLLAAAPDVGRTRAPDVGDVSGIDIASCIPVAARAHVLLEKSEPEHRTITAAFIDMMDTDRLLEELGPEGLAQGLDERMRSIQEGALKYDVPFYESDVGKSSVKALLTAGAPSSTGHDEERMLRALREIMDQPGVVPMRVGVNTGKVFTGDFGPPYRRAYRVFGDAINTAARVMSKAEAGQILSTEIVLDRSRTIFQTTPIEPFAAKGKAEPVRASIVGQIAGAKDARRGGVALIGRDRELDTLLGFVDEARNGASWLLEVTGEPGVGKSRLVEELVERAPDFRILHAECEEYESTTPYFPMRALMRTLLELDADSPTDAVVERLGAKVREVDERLLGWLPLLGVLLGVDLPATADTAALDERFVRDGIAEVAIAFLDGRLGDSPALLVAENAQHMDEATRDLLLRLSVAGDGKKRALVVTHTETGEMFAPSGGPTHASVTLCLLPLAFAAAVEIVNVALDDDPLAPHEVEEIAGRSAGNAVFLFELIDAARASGSGGALPDSIESLIAGQIDRLSPTDRTVLRYAAVLGSTFDPALLADAVRGELDLDDRVWSRLSDLLDGDAATLLRFRNSLTRDAAYEGLPYRRRRFLHERIGRTIEARAGDSLDDEIGSLALHFFEAQRWDKAWRYSRQAGDRAMRVYANVDAAQSYERAVFAGRRSRVDRRELAAVYELLGDVRYSLGEFERADLAFKAARRLVPAGTAEAANLAVKQVNGSTRLGKYTQALNRISRALASIEGIDGRKAAAERARLYNLYGWVKVSQGRSAEAIDWCLRSSQEARRARADAALAQAYRILDMAYTQNGQAAKAKYGKRALALYEKGGDLWQVAATLNNLAIVEWEFSRWAEYQELLERAQMLFETVGDRTMACLVMLNLAEIFTDQGRYDEAEPLLREVLRVWRASAQEGDVGYVRRELGKLAARRGEMAAAYDLFSAARAEQLSSNQPHEVLNTDCRLAETLALDGESEAALTVADDALARAQEAGTGSSYVPLLRRVRGWALLQDGLVDASHGEFVSALEAASERNNLYEAALALDGLAAVGWLRGDDVQPLAAERNALLLTLGVEKTPTFPVTRSTGAAPPRLSELAQSTGANTALAAMGPPA